MRQNHVRDNVLATLDRREQRWGMVWPRVRIAAGSGCWFARLGGSNRMGLGRYEALTRQKLVSKVSPRDRRAMIPLIDQKDVKMRPHRPTLGGSRSPAFRTNTPNQRQLKAMPLVSRES